MTFVAFAIYAFILSAFASLGLFAAAIVATDGRVQARRHIASGACSIASILFLVVAVMALVLRS